MATHARSTITFAITSPLERSDLPGLFKRVCALLERSNASMALCDVRDASADAVTVDALARLQLAAHRSGCQVRLCHASAELQALVALMGLQDVLAD
jgi:ABC-type transporter Mla MlaB component